MPPPSSAIVVGAGPIGSFAARLLAERGLRVLLLEEHDEVGIPPHCAGLVSRACPPLFGLGRAPVLAEIRGARVHLPSGRCLEVVLDEPVAVVLDRVRFDRELARLAERAGAELLLSHRAVSVDRGGLKVKTPRGMLRLEADLIVLAEGMVRRLTRIVAGPTPAGLPAYQEEREGVPLSPEDMDKVEIFVGREVSDGLFGWLIPIGRSRVRVGLASRPPLRPRLLRLLRHPRLAELLDGSEVIARMGGLVNVAGPLDRFVYWGGRVALVGDAAGQDKPTTGGGLYYGAIGARLLALAVSSGDVSSYERLWARVCGREISRMLRLRKALDALSDEELVTMVDALRRAGLEEALARRARFDEHSTVIVSGLGACLRGLPLLLAEGSARRALLKVLLAFLPSAVPGKLISPLRASSSRRAGVAQPGRAPDS